MSTSFHAAFDEEEDAKLFPLLEAADLKEELARPDTPMARYLEEARFHAIAGYKSLAEIDYADRDTWEKARANIRAYELFRNFIAATLQKGDIAYAESDLSTTGGDTDIELEDDEAGRIPFAPD